MRKRSSGFPTRSHTNRAVQPHEMPHERNCTIRVAKTKGLISFAVIAKLICVFVFAYAKSWFSHDEARKLSVVSISEILWF